MLKDANGDGKSREVIRHHSGEDRLSQHHPAGTSEVSALPPRKPSTDLVDERLKGNRLEAGWAEREAQVRAGEGDATGRESLQGRSGLILRTCNREEGRFVEVDA